jgi:RNA polymerase sigma factor (sigma-70 family)
MIQGQSGAVVRQVQRLFEVGTAASVTEGQLLERYLEHRDEVAFEALVARHGPMVLGVCRRMLRDPQDVEDAFQATFLVLLRKGGSIRDRELLGNWLYGVAQRVSMKARARPSRVGMDSDLAHLEDSRSDPDPDGFELRSVLDQELARLPEKYRAPIVLCYLEGHTHEEAAARLGWPVGTVRGRLARARDTLRGRLFRRGLAPASAALTAVLTQDARAAVPESLLLSTVRAAGQGAAGSTAAAGAVSAAWLLAESVMGGLTMTKLKMIAAGLLAIGLVTGTAVVSARQEGVERKPSLPTVQAQQAPASEADRMKIEGREPLPAPEAIAEKKAAPEPLPSSKPVLDDPKQPDAEELLKETRARIDAAVIGLETEVQTLSTRLEKAQQDLRRLKALQEAFTATQDHPVSRDGAVISNGPTDAVPTVPDPPSALSVSEVPPPPSPEDSMETGPPRKPEGPPSSPVDQFPNSEAAAPSKGAEGEPEEASPHQIQPGDLLQVEILEALPGRPIQGLRRVRTDGTISLDWYGELKVKGLTRRDAKVAIIKHMQKYITDESLGLLNPQGKPIDPALSDTVFVDDSPLESVGATAQAAVAAEQRLLRLEAMMDRLLKRLNAPK